jgi:ABC-2 type transport system permease protein
MKNSAPGAASGDDERITPAVAARLVLHQTRYDLLIFVRNRQSTFFTLALPVIFLVIFASVFGNDTTRLIGGEQINGATYYVPQIVALGIVSAAFNNVVSTVITQRETGVLKRRRATPVPAWVIVAGRTLTAILIAVVLVVVLLTVGRVFYGVRLPSNTLPGVVLTTVVGALALCCVAYAMTTFISSADSAQPAIQAITLPIFFISGVFFPENIVPRWLIDVANIFPVRHLAQALLVAFNPTTTGSGINTGHLLILGLWGIAGMAIATRRFTWTSKRGGQA